MKSSAGSLLLSLGLTLAACGASLARSKCTCRPSPPGGVTECSAGQIAVCGDDGRGVCKGSCIDPPAADLQPMPYTAAVLRGVLRRDVTEERLRKEAKVFRPIVEKLIKSSRGDKTVTFEFEGARYRLGVGLSDAAENKLRAASAALAVIIKPKAKARINIPLPVRY